MSITVKPAPEWLGSGIVDMHNGWPSYWSHGQWHALPLRKLAMAYGVETPVWRYLKENGVNRPSPSGSPHPGRGEDGRTTERVNLRLGERAYEKLLELAKGSTIAATIERLIMAKRVRK